MANGGGSSAMELRVLINILQSGAGLQSILAQVNAVSKAITALQTQANAAGGVASGATAAAAATQNVAAGAKAATAGLTSMAQAGNAANLSMAGLEKTANKLIAAVRFVTVGFLGLQSIRFLKGLADEAARVQVMGTVLHVVASNAGVTAEEVDKVDKAVQRLGITAESSRNSLTQMMQAKLDLKFAPQLARAAQDLAVIADSNSSDVFRRMIINIQQLDTLGLRWMGIIIDRQQAEQKYKATHTEITGALQKRHQQEALMLEVLEKAKQLEGTYSSAMGDVGKQLTSLERLTKTYRQLLGDSLLPAYSAIVGGITTLLEKMIILSREFSGNRDRAQEWADMATTVMSVVEEFILLIMKNIDAIVLLAEWYVKFKIASYAIAGSAAVWAWVTGVVATLGRFKLILDATRTAQVSLALAQKMLAAASNEEALALLKVAQAQTAVASTAVPAAAGMTAVATGASTATLAVELLLAAWRTLIITMAVPAVGYVIHKIVQYATTDHAPEEEAARQREVDPMIKLMGELKAGTGGVFLFTKFFEDWKKNNPALVSDLKTDVKLMEEFVRQMDVLDNKKISFPLLEKLTQARMELDAARVVFEKIPKGAADKPARDIAAQRMTDAKAAFDLIDKQMKDTLKAEQALPVSKMLELADAVNKAERDVVRTRALPGGPEGNAEALATAEAMRTILSERLKTQVDFQQARLDKLAITDPTRKANQAALDSMKKTLVGLVQAGEEYNAAIKQIFGEDEFRDGGRISAGFKKLYGPLEALITEAKNRLKAGEPIGDAIATQITGTMEKIGKAVETPMDMSNLEEVTTTLKELPIAGLGAVSRDALQIGRRQALEARLAIRAPIVTETKEQITTRADALISAAKRTQESVRARGALETADLEARNKEQAIVLDKYYKERERIVEEGFEAEYAVAAEELLKRRQLEAAEQDPRLQRSAADATAAAQAELDRIANRRQEELDKLEKEQIERRRALNLEVRLGLAQQAAETGGPEEAKKLSDIQLEQEALKLSALSNEDAKRFLTNKETTDEYERQKKELERQLQLQIGIEDVVQRQLDLHQQQRDIEAARDRVLATRGDITTQEAMQRNNARIAEAQADNRQKRVSEQNKVELNRAAAAKDINILFDKMARQGASQENITKALADKQNEWNLRIIEGEAAVLGLDAAWEELAASAQLYSTEIKDTAVNAMSDAMASMTTDFKKAGEVWMNMARTISDSIVRIFTKKLSEVIVAKLFNNFSFLDKWMGLGGGKIGGAGAGGWARGGVVDGPGTGTSDSIPAMVSAGEHIMPASKAARWMPLLEGIRLGKLSPAFALGGVVALQSIAPGSIIPRRYAGGGAVMTDAGASAVQTGNGNGNMTIALHPDALNMTMRDWLEHEVVRQHGRR